MYAYFVSHMRILSVKEPSSASWFRSTIVIIIIAASVAAASAPIRPAAIALPQFCFGLAFQYIQMLHLHLVPRPRLSGGTVRPLILGNAAGNANSSPLSRKQWHRKGEERQW